VATRNRERGLTLRVTLPTRRTGTPTWRSFEPAWTRGGWTSEQQQRASS